MPTETELRSQLAKRLDLIEPGLELIEEDHVLANEQGASERADVLARRVRDNCYLVIELKKKNKTARQTFNALSKYVISLRAKYGISDEQIRCIVASTHWHELLIPLCEFKRDVIYEVAGKRITLIAQDAIDKLEDVNVDFDPPVRRFCPHHVIYCYLTSESRDDDTQRIIDSSVEAGCKDFVIVAEDYEGAGDAIIYRYISYFAMLVLPRSYEPPQVRHPQDVNEDVHRESALEGEIDDESVEETDANEWAWEDSIMERQREIYTKNFDIRYDEMKNGHPDTFAGIVQHWTNRQIVRHGSLDVDTQVISDVDIVADLSSFGLANPRYLDVRVRPNHRLEWQLMKNELLDRLSQAVPWREAALSFLSRIEREYPDNPVRVWLFHRQNIIVDICNFINQQETDLIPQLEITVVTEEDELIIAMKGTVDWDQQARPENPTQVIEQLFGSRTNFMRCNHFGNPEHEPKVLEHFGLSYGSLEISVSDNSPVIRKFAGGDVQEPEIAVNELRTVLVFIQQNFQFCTELYSYLAAHND